MIKRVIVDIVLLTVLIHSIGSKEIGWGVFTSALAAAFIAFVSEYLMRFIPSRELALLALAVWILFLNKICKISFINSLAVVGLFIVAKFTMASFLVGLFPFLAF